MEPKATKQLFATIEIPAITQEAPAMDKPTSQNTGDQPENPLVKQAKEDLANRLDVETEHIELVEFKAMIWPDSSLGCPQPGVAYTQVQREGYLIRLHFEGKLFHYHGGENRSPFLCEKTASDEGLLPPPGLGDD
jgi:hypothetical protein